MRRKTVDFQTQIKNSQQFLQKLQSIKNTSKEIKDKSKLTLHRNIWVKQFKYLSRLERDASAEITSYLEDFDRYFQYQLQQRDIFANLQSKSYSQLLHQYSYTLSIQQANTWAQLHSLPLLLTKLKSNNHHNIDFNQIRSIIDDIGSYLTSIGKHNQTSLSNYSKTFFQQQEDNQDAEDAFEDFIFGEVKGFDFHKGKYRKIQQGQQNLINYLQSMTDQLSEDQISQVIQEFYHASNLLQQAMELEIEKINLDYEQALSLDKQLTLQSDNFHKINHFYHIYLGRGKSVGHYYERLHIQFPKINRKILERITNFIEAKIYKDKKIKTIKRNYLREKQQMYTKVEKEVNLRIENKIKKAQKQAENLSRKQQKLKLQKQLERLRQQYNKRVQAKHQQQTLIEQQKKQQQRKREALRKLYLDDLSKRVVEIHQIKTEKQNQQQLQIKQQREKQENQRKKQIQANKPKVNYRHSVDKKKIQKKLQERQYKKNQKIIKQNRINEAIQKYPFRPIIEPSQQRLNAPTQALTKKLNTKYDMADKILLTKVDGYTVNQLMSDMRYKLNAALQDAGLSHTQYAREVIIHLSKPNKQ